MTTHKVTDKVISKVQKGPSGEGEYGPWQIYNMYFVGSENKYSWFQKDGIVPIPGTKVMFMKYDIVKKEKDGKEYTNYNIKEIEFDTASLANNVSTGGTSSNNVSNNNLSNSSCTMFISYAKDILDAQIMTGRYKEVSFRELNELYIQEGMRGFYRVQDWLKTNMAMDGAGESEKEDIKATHPESEEELPEMRDDEPPFPGDFDGPV